MNQLADKVVAYSLPDEGNEVMYGLCIRREGDTLRVMVLQKDDDREAPLKSVLRKLSDEDSIVNTLENRFSSLQAKLTKERNAGGLSKNYRLQETMLQWATHRLEGIDAEEWRRLAQQRHPSAVVKAVGCAAASIASDAKLVSSAWTDAQKLFGKGKDMPTDLRRAGEQRMNKTLYNSLEETYITDSSLSYALVAQEAPSLSILHKWITALVDYQRARYMEDGEAELQQQLAGCQNSLQSARERRGSLMEQAALINTGNCYIRTQTVRSVPVDCVLSLMTAEKVTTRQYLLKDAAPLELLDEVMSRAPASARSARGSRQEDSFARHDFLSARIVGAPTTTLRGNRTGSGVEIPPIHIPKVESARVGTWMGGRFVRNERPSLSEAAENTAGSSGSARSGHIAGGSTVAIPKVSPRHTLAHVAPETVNSGAETPSSATNGAAHTDAAAGSPSSSSPAPSPTTPSMHIDAKQISEPTSQGRMLSARHGAAEPMQVLMDVKNNFISVQAVLLACLDDYQKLEDKYASTVEHSRQLLQTLEHREQTIAQLQQERATALAAAATATQLASKTMSTALHDACVGTSARHRILEDMYTSGSATPPVPTADDMDDTDSYEQRFEQMLYDTLEFLQGTASAPTMYEVEPNQE
jgi:hypothetical protein